MQGWAGDEKSPKEDVKPTGERYGEGGNGKEEEGEGGGGRKMKVRGTHLQECHFKAWTSYT